MPYPSILAFIEGSMEQAFVRTNFRYASIIPVKNGTGWSVPQMCEQIGTLYAARNHLPDKIVVWIDREGRSEERDHIRSMVRDRLLAEGAPPDRLAIMICDRMTENLLLADTCAIGEYLDIEGHNYCGDSVGGKGQMKQLFLASGRHYKEMKDGLKLLNRIRLSRAAVNSQFAAEFREELNLPCWWDQ